MDKRGNFTLKLVISERDRNIIDDIIRREIRDPSLKGYTDWLNLGVRKFCQCVALPYIEQHRDGHRETSIAATIYNTPTIMNESVTYLEILSEFARVKNLSITQAIERYIFSPRIISVDICETQKPLIQRLY